MHTSINSQSWADKLMRDESYKQGIVEGEARGKAEGKAEGKVEGRMEGLIIGSIKSLLGLVKDGLISLEDAIKRSGLTEPQFNKYASLV